MSTATLLLKGREYELPVIEGSEGETAIDITSLRAKSGAITFDPGYANTGSCASAITFIDGEKGILRYRGYPIEELARQCTFVEVCYLLIHGHLPSPAELIAFDAKLTRHSLIHEDMKKFFEGFPPSAHPMAILSAMVASLSAYYPNSGDSELNIIRLLSKAKTIAAFSYKKSVGQPFIYPRNDLTYTQNFMHMMFAVPAEDYVVSPAVDRALNLLLILHADHEQNCSTSTVRMVGSSGANLFASISAGICALWGPLHGGANQHVIEMLQQIRESGQSPRAFVERAKQKDSGFKLMGFGHRVYKNFDPRATILKKAADEVLASLGMRDPLLDTAIELEQIALTDPYFIERKLYPNVDFYSGILYRAMGIPTNMFTVMFALGRLPGWIAQWKEMVGDDKTRINRPRQVYAGNTVRNIETLEEALAMTV
ncbi:MAG: citrate synthase [Acidobacteria bacterium]|nr:citrate synthase [Acidobacteriota bacterium]MBV9068782.1 citrate synthase [Acidobacteriota bacterium]MBV9187993.1 citrate synthase [Acidobacteriota bacterium]